MSGGDGIPRQRAFICNSLDDEQRSDHLQSPALRQITCSKVGLCESTNLSLRKDTQEETGSDGVVGVPRPDNQQRGHCVKGTRLDEHGDDGLGHSTHSAYSHGSASVPGVSDEPDDDHEGEEGVK